MIEFENLSEIVAATLVGKKLLYINSKPYKDAKIIGIDSMLPHDEIDSIHISIIIESPFKSGTRKRTVRFLNDDRIVVE